MKTEPGRNTELLWTALRCMNSLGSQGGAQQKVELCQARLGGGGEGNPGQPARENAGQHHPGGSWMQVCNLSAEERGTPDMWSTTNTAGGGTQNPESKLSLETSHFEQEITTTTRKWVMIALGEG